MNEKKSPLGWLFVCFLPTEKKFVCHVVANPSFFKALTEHSAIFPSHHIVYTMQLPLFLAEYIGKQLQENFSDYDTVYSQFSKLINTPAPSFIVAPIKSYKGLIPLTYSELSKRFALSNWKGEYYESAQAFVLHASLIEFFNSIFFVTENNILNLFKSHE